MRRTHTGVLAIVSTMAVTSLALAQTGVSIPEVVYSVGVTTLTGRQGSVSGPESFSEGPIPGAVSAQGGVFGKQFTSSVGPVLPGQIISLPGTEGVATASSLARITVTPLTNACTIRLQVNNNHSVINMDGGGYLATGGGFTSVTIHVRETTSYTLTGTLALDTEDPTSYMQFVGQPIFIVPSGNGPINFTGTLAPGYYALRSGTASSAPLFPQNTGNDADSSSLDLLLTPTSRWSPTTATPSTSIATASSPKIRMSSISSTCSRAAPARSAPTSTSTTTASSPKIKTSSTSSMFSQAVSARKPRTAAPLQPTAHACS